MIHTLAVKIVDFLMKYGTAKKSRSIYIYGTECFISECIGNILLFAIAFPLHEEYRILIWLISFLSIRIHIGGYHADSHWMCLIISTLVGASSILLNWIWSRLGIYSLLILTLCDAYILFTKAVIHPKHPISAQKAHRERYFLLINTIIENIIIFTCFILHYDLYAPILSGIICAVLMSFAKKIFPN